MKINMNRTPQGQLGSRRSGNSQAGNENRKVNTWSFCSSIRASNTLKTKELTLRTLMEINVNKTPQGSICASKLGVTTKKVHKIDKTVQVLTTRKPSTLSLTKMLKTKEPTL